MPHWADQAVFYHLYPLGLCGAPQRNDPKTAPAHRLERLIPWLDQARDLGATAVYLGPVLESSAHGYDIADFFHVDRRLGDDQTLAWIADEIRARGLKLVMEGVFHHVGRDFWAFRDVLAYGPDSRFRDWFHLDFSRPSPLGDPFAYQSWNGCHDLVKLNLQNPEVRSHLWEAVATWLREYDPDGLRLDAADHLPTEFIADLGSHCRALKPGFWLLGEVVAGDYRPLLEAGGLDSVTNYEAYKGLFSSHNDANYHEIAYTLRRQFGPRGLYPGRNLYAFTDNHDVNRLASRLANPAHLYPVHGLLFTLPGIPAIYYGSEFGLAGVKNPSDDWPLRPALDLDALRAHPPQPDLPAAIRRLASLRRTCPALAMGDYRELALAHRHLAFSRRCPQQWLVVAVSAEPQPIDLAIRLPDAPDGALVDLLNPGQAFPIKNGCARLDPLWPNWARVLEVRRDGE